MPIKDRVQTPWKSDIGLGAEHRPQIVVSDFDVLGDVGWPAIKEFDFLDLVLATDDHLVSLGPLL